ncbi:MAG: UbiD family decarboxylase [Chloroflexi bacterium]|nr:UbiD family decarboxylase [Chloroflexota bacterium]
MGYYKDIVEHIKGLEDRGKLVRIKRPVNKDTELMPLVRLQFRGLPEEQRKAFLFENIFDSRGREYHIPVVVACHAASREIYAIGMMCRTDEIMEKWSHAQLNPIKPVMAAGGPAQEEIHAGDGLLEHGGLDEFPVPISTPGIDNAPYLSSANWVTRDPETGIRNMGNYRAMVKSPLRTGVYCEEPQHLRTHWELCKARGIPLQAAIVIGGPPNIGFAATAKLPYGADEYEVAGGIAGEPIALVKCKTVDLEVPASAHIIIEGQVPTDSMEREAPFGEFTGYVGKETLSMYFNVTGITHCKTAVYNQFLSQFPPSESSKLRGVAMEATFYKFLKNDCAIAGVLDVAFHESGGSEQYCVIKMKKSHPSQVWQALHAVVSRHPWWRKIVIAVDEDIDPRDPDSVNWALSFRMQPHSDIRIVTGRSHDIDPSAAPMDDPERRYPKPDGVSSVLINATRKWDYPPVSLPRQEFMERAKQIWQEEGLPPLKLKVPWHGYSLGYWSERNEQEAQLAVQGRYYETGEKIKEQRTEV